MACARFAGPHLDVPRAACRSPGPPPFRRYGTRSAGGNEHPRKPLAVSPIRSRHDGGTCGPRAPLAGASATLQIVLDGTERERVLDLEIDGW